MMEFTWSDQRDNAYEFASRLTYLNSRRRKHTNFAGFQAACWI